MRPYDNTPWLYKIPMMTHYYGNTIRQLFLGAAVVMLVGAPFYSDDLSTQGPALVIGAVILTVAAGVMSPQMRFAKMAGVAIAMVGAIFFELWALSEYQATQMFTALFVIRQILALIFFFALYFSLKTARADVLERLAENVEREDDADMTELVAEAEEAFASDAGDSHVHTDSSVGD